MKYCKNCNNIKHDCECDSQISKSTMDSRFSLPPISSRFDEFNKRMLGIFEDPEVELFNLLNNSSVSYLAKNASFKVIGEDIEVLSSLQSYARILKNTDRKFTSYFLTKKIIEKILSGQKEYENKTFSEKAMFWHDRIYDVVNIVRLHNTFRDNTEEKLEVLGIDLGFFKDLFCSEPLSVFETKKEMDKKSFLSISMLLIMEKEFL